MKTKVSLKMFVLSVVLLMTSFVASARSYDGQLVYNPVEENGVMVGQTVYKMNGSTLANYMKYNYKYDDNKRMIESETLKWNSTKEEWEKDLRINYTYEGKTVTTNYYKWNNKKRAYVLVPEMTVTITTQRTGPATLSKNFGKSPDHSYHEKADKVDNTSHQSSPDN